MYLEHRKGEVSKNTLQGYHYRLKHFIRWCDEKDVDDMNEVDGRALHRYRTWRRNEGDIKKITLHGQLTALRGFIRFCESIDAVEEGLHDKILLPVMDEDEEISDEHLDGEDAKKLLDNLCKFEYASKNHIVMSVLWHTGIRIGTLHALDLEDYNDREARLELKHRPQTDTPLKNREKGERYVALTKDVCNIINDWITHNRPETTDEHGREPLITGPNGRLTISSIRSIVYTVTRPCYYTDTCPHSRDMDTCEATKYGSESKCPSSVSPHSIRRGSITHFLSEDVPEEVVSDRMNVSRDILNKHYDKRSEEQKVEQRRQHLSNV